MRQETEQGVDNNLPTPERLTKFLAERYPDLALGQDVNGQTLKGFIEQSRPGSEWTDPSGFRIKVDEKGFLFEETGEGEGHKPEEAKDERNDEEKLDEVVESKARRQTQEYFTRLHKEFLAIKDEKEEGFADLLRTMTDPQSENYYKKIGTDSKKLQDLVTDNLNLGQGEKEQELARDIAGHLVEALRKIEPVKQIDENIEKHFVTVLAELLDPSMRMQREYLSPAEPNSWYNTPAGKPTLEQIKSDARKELGIKTE